MVFRCSGGAVKVLICMTCIYYGAPASLPHSVRNIEVILIGQFWHELAVVHCIALHYALGLLHRLQLPSG
jgi:hypothetical protein